MIKGCHLIDLGFQDQKFTRTNCRAGALNIRKCLDRAWYNIQGHIRFERLTIHHLATATSNNHSLLINDEPKKRRRSFKGFKYLNAWFQHPDFTSAMEQFCTREPSDLEHNIADFKEKMMQWNSKIFGNIFQRKKVVDNC